MILIKYVNDVEVDRVDVAHESDAFNHIIVQVETHNLVLEKHVYLAPNGDAVRFAFSQESWMAMLRKALTEEANKDG